MMFVATLLLWAAAGHGRPQPDACTLLTKADLAAVQGEAFTATKLTARPGGTTCFYQLPTFTRSVSVDLMRSGGREFWETHFEKERDGENEEGSAPTKVRGVGSEALWVGSRVAGSLYVRKGDALLRVSVGGPGTLKEKIARSRSLAKRALQRM